MTTTLQQPLTRLLHRLQNPSFSSSSSNQSRSLCPPWQCPQIQNCHQLHHLSSTHAPSGAPDEAMQTPTGKLVWVVKDVSRLGASLREVVLLEKAEGLGGVGEEIAGRGVV